MSRAHHHLDNDKEIFTDAAPQWWDANGAMQTLHAITPLRLQLIIQTLRNFLPNRPFTSLKGADVGCGGGLVTEPLARLGITMHGFDRDETLINVARQHAQRSHSVPKNLTYEVSDISHVDHYITQGTLDFVLCLEVLEHTNDVDESVKKICSTLKPNGIAFFSTINRTVASRILAITVAENVLRWVPRNTHRWSQFIRPHTLAAIARKYNHRVIASHGLSYHVPTMSWRVTRDLSVNYFLFTQRCDEDNTESST